MSLYSRYSESSISVSYFSRSSALICSAVLLRCATQPIRARSVPSFPTCWQPVEPAGPARLGVPPPPATPGPHRRPAGTLPPPIARLLLGPYRPASSPSAPGSPTPLALSGDLLRSTH